MNPALAPSNTQVNRIGNNLYGGWMSKRGRGRGMSGFFGVFRPWATRYFTIDNVSGVMTYYDTEEDGENRANEKGIYHIFRCIYRYSSFVFGVEYLFLQSYHHHSVILVCAIVIFGNLVSSVPVKLVEAPLLPSASSWYAFYVFVCILLLDKQKKYIKDMLFWRNVRSLWTIGLLVSISL